MKVKLIDRTYGSFGRFIAFSGALFSAFPLAFFLCMIFLCIFYWDFYGYVMALDLILLPVTKFVFLPLLDVYPDLNDSHYLLFLMVPIVILAVPALFFSTVRTVFKATVVTVVSWVFLCVMAMGSNLGWFG